MLTFYSHLPKLGFVHFRVGFSFIHARNPNPSRKRKINNMHNSNKPSTMLLCKRVYFPTCVLVILLNCHAKAFAPNPNVFQSGRNHFLPSQQVAITNPIEIGKAKNEKRSFSRDQHKSEIKVPLKRKEFPFHMIVGQSELKEAAVIAASNPKVCGILIGGRHGTGKSVIARAIHQLLPETIRRVKGSVYNVEPEGKDGIDSFLLEELVQNGLDIKDLENESITTPFVQIPLNIMEDSLCGTVDIEKSILSGETVFIPGLLAKAHRGILYIDDIHLLDDSILGILFEIISDGWVTVEREGLR